MKDNGLTVEHDKFGRGTIKRLEVRGDGPTILAIDFDDSTHHIVETDEELHLQQYQGTAAKVEQ